MRPRPASLLFPFVALLAPLAAMAVPSGSARAESVASSAASSEGRGCLTPEDAPGSGPGLERESVAATCGKRGACDDPVTRDGAVRSMLNLRAVAHVFRSNDGTCALSAAAVRGAIDEMNADLRANDAGIQIDLGEIQDHVDDDIAWLPNCDNDGCVEARRLIYLARELYAEAPHAQLNLYFSCQRNSRFSGLAGAASFPWYASPPAASMGLWLNSASIASGTAHLGTHELGHVLGLLHTQRGVSEVSGCSAGCAENVSRLDADVRGDFAADTPATPENTTCFAPGGSDCNGDLWGLTQPQNYMGYGPPGCVNRFTTDQAQRMQCWAQSALNSWYSTPAGPCRRAATASTAALWHFDEASGSSLDEDIGAVDGTLLGTTSRTKSHCGSPCLSFTAAADGARLLGMDFTLPRGSVECSFRWTGGAGGWLFDRERTAATSDLGALLTADGRIHFHLGGAERVVSERTIEIDRWYRLACTWDGASARIEIDDVPDAVAATSATPVPGGGDLIVGSAGLLAPAVGGFVGQIDEVTVSRAPAAHPPFPEPDRTPQLSLSAIPNPFSGATAIAFVLPVAARARLQIFDLLGRRVATLVDGSLAAGPHRFDWDGRRSSGEPVSPGLYVLRIAAGNAWRGITLARIP